MIRTLKFIFLGMGICLIIASFLTGMFRGTAEAEEGMPFSDGPDFVLQEGDEFPGTVEDYTDENMQPAEEDGDNTVIVVIPEGARGSDVTEILLERGLIENGDEFESRLVELEQDRRIIYGTYRISGDGDMDLIIETITTGGI